ncbi:hypothetical protein L1049_015815 [Liquidambar formosana]|uniref:Uncharacterized protein n=1 Tax=Liquidambar formosana TaxID=63359 RepID=A0AAP0X2S2_LIQFO
MEKKESSKRKVPKKPSRQKIFGGNAIQIDEAGASWLIGSIVEKGISDEPQTMPLTPSSAPKPTVLPFPVARHRSHGPVSPFLHILTANINSCYRVVACNHFPAFGCCEDVGKERKLNGELCVFFFFSYVFSA